MRIVLEFNSVLTHRYSGFFTYGAGLLEGFASLEDRPEVALFCSRRAWRRRAWLDRVDQSLGARWITPPCKMRHLAAWWRHLPMPSLQLLAGRFDLYHCNHHVMPPTRRRPRLLTVHDLRRYRLPQLYPHSKLGPFEHAVRTTDHFIAISQSTKSDLQEFFGLAPERIDVVHHGGPLTVIGAASNGSEPRAHRPGAAWLRRSGLQAGRYFAAFSSYDRRKNLPGICRAFYQAWLRLGDKFRLVVIGTPPADQEVLWHDLPPALRPAVVFTGPLGDFTPILAGAVGLIYASFYEGFGLPIVEAMAAGTAVITSNCSSMPEVAGTAALFVDPNVPETIAEAMVRLVQDAALRDRLIAAGHQRARQFSWPRAARETLAVYRKLA